MVFKDRGEAGRQLASLLEEEGVEADIVLAIPRGGLPLGREVADALNLPLDVVVARKMGAPHNPELAIGAVASDGTVWRNEELIQNMGIEGDYIREQSDIEKENARQKLETYREGEEPLDVAGKHVLVVDDGVATGATTTACVRHLKNAGAEEVLLAVPVGAPETIRRLEKEVDQVFCPEQPANFQAVGQVYENFEQVTDEEAKQYLKNP